MCALVRPARTIVRGGKCGKGPISTVCTDDNCAQITIIGVPQEVNALQLVFASLAEESINVDMIVKTSGRDSTTSLSFTVQRSDLPGALEAIYRLPGAEGWEVTANEDVAKVSIVGAGMMTNPGVAAAMFDVLAEVGVPVELVTTSEIKVSCLVPRNRLQEAVAACHRRFCLK